MGKKKNKEQVESMSGKVLKGLGYAALDITAMIVPVVASTIVAAKTDAYIGELDKQLHPEPKGFWIFKH